MASTPAFLESLLQGMQPPAWVIDGVQHRLVLFLNHVLMREDEARARLAGQRGRVLRVQWRSLSLMLRCTPAGLLERADPQLPADLTLEVSQPSPLQLAQGALAGERPPLSIQGDVQLAAEVGWLVENVRWDVEEDLAGLLGDSAAHTVSQGAARLAAALRRFVGAARPGGKTGA